MIRNLPMSLAIGAVCLAAMAPAAGAQPYALRTGVDLSDATKVVRYTTIPHADLDLGSSTGARKLLERIEDAADAVCGGAANAVSKREKESYGECRAIAVAVAVRKMRSPALTRLASDRREELRAAR
jgi:UrcA family protein